MQDSKQLLLVHVASSTSVHDNGYNILTYDLRNCGLSGEADDAPLPDEPRGVILTA